MIGSFLSRTLIMMFGYAFPAYECYKVVEKIESEIPQLKFWCQYWILVAMITVCERVGDNLISWFPMYSEAKLAFFVYLWYPKTRGTMHVYNCFLRKFLRQHETEIDRRLMELRVKGGKIVLICCEKAALYGQTKFFEILRCASSPSILWSNSEQKEAITDTPNGETCDYDPVRQQTKERQFKEPTPHSQQQQENLGNEAISYGNTESSQKGTVARQSIQMGRGKWRLFKTTAAAPNC